MRRLKRLSRKYTAIGRRKLKRAHPLRGHPFVLPVLTFLGLVFVSAVGLVISNTQTIGASDSRIVTVSVDGAERTVPTRAKKVSDLLKNLEITVNDQDIVSPKLDTPILEDDMKITVQQARPVTILDGGRATTVLSPHQQPRTVIKQAGITLYPEDGIETQTPVESPNKSLIIGDQIVVDRATPVSINLYGNNISVRSRAKTVADLLEQKDIKTIDGDTIQPAPETPITEGLQVFVVRYGKQVITSEEVIPAPVANEDDPSLALGSTVVKDPGLDGKKIVTYELDLQNGTETGRRVLQEVIAVNPVRRVVAKGTKVLVTGGRAEWLVAAGISPSEYYAVDYIVGRESGWCPTKWQGEYGGCPAFHGAPTSPKTGYGLCQATPGYKMASAGADWASNPITQLKWCTGYARGRYGSWSAAYQFWVVNHWW